MKFKFELNCKEIIILFLARVPVTFLVPIWSDMVLGRCWKALES